MPHRVLVVTNRGDIHADVVGNAIAASASPVFRLDLDRFPVDYELDLSSTDGRWTGEIMHRPTGDTVAIAAIGATWLRKAGRFTYLSDPLPAQERAHADAETEHMLLGLLHALDGYWMSRPSALRAASWKPEQLQRAARFGFDVPPSIITDDPVRVKTFRREHGSVVFKPLSSPYLAAESVAAEERTGGVLTTTLLSDEHDDALAAVAEAPCFFQRYVPKRYEWRVTVVGDAIFAARIDSQADARTTIDSRDMSAEIAYEAGMLPPTIADQCRALIRSYDLAFGAIDLIETPDSDWVFLENNPQGQFLYVEQLVPELRITEAVAHALVRGAVA